MKSHRTKWTKLQIVKKSNCENTVLLESFNKVYSKINSLDENDFSQENLKKFLSLCKLKEEIKG